MTRLIKKLSMLGKIKVLERAIKGKVQLIRGRTQNQLFSTQHHGGEIHMPWSSNDKHDNKSEILCICYRESS